ncbi:putative 115 kDa protein in type-1 retrotransposable element R1DM [Purpureocillium lavendulum]|uniref:ubiquitinyl hydrolase 1 n=1 Tax=Purpureocillium lavendulum TaxID=1247861 RepID=A0AB34FCL1_9HYPO|nr:putative 115 kDa protein in type-1 retrotransposable element R1DM [Purpureocillium lavendulum]
MKQGDFCGNPDVLNLDDLFEVCRKRCADALSRIRAALLLIRESVSPLTHVHNVCWQIAAQTQAWPDLSKRSLFALMGRLNWRAIPVKWKESIISLGTNICDLQAVERLLAARNNMQDFNKELVGLEPRGWDPKDYPDSLLLEIEGNIRIRGIQGDIAAVMREPPEGLSAVMQLNMGEGKSSVIVPTIAAALADGSRLVKVVVAKPQSRQMLDVLASKLGGLMNRRIYRMPFSRSVKLDVPQVHILTEIYKRCVSDGGVMIVQPEHVLSFQLLTVETAIRGDKALAQNLWHLHKMLNLGARDIVDESDENFSTKFELIYTIGDQRTVEHGPERWVMIQRVLGIILKYSRQAKAEFAQGVEFDEESRNSFPLTRFLSIEAGDGVLLRSISEICKRGFQNFPIARQNEQMRSRLQDYIMNLDPSIQTSTTVEGGEFWTEFKNNILLLRGLFAGGILRFVFGQKRWRVNYGLDPARRPSTRLAVPYRAKDSPSPRSEFSHPDVVICLTYLSYYYGGLSNDDLTISLDLLLRSDQADLEYQEWVTTSDGLRESFHHPKSINLRDREQCLEDIFPSFRHSKGAVDYFLSHFVFPIEMKEFPHKLSASGWDLATPRQHPLTGFSGTRLRNRSYRSIPSLNRSIGILLISIVTIHRSSGRRCPSISIDH